MLRLARDEPALQRHHIALRLRAGSAVKSGDAMLDVRFYGDDAIAVAITKDEIGRMRHGQAYRFGFARPCAFSNASASASALVRRAAMRRVDRSGAASGWAASSLPAMRSV